MDRQNERFHASREAEAEQQAANTTRILEEVGIASIQQALNGQGSEECEDCLQPIPAKRREAYPAATRCVGCQQIHDNERGIPTRRVM